LDELSVVEDLSTAQLSMERALLACRIVVRKSVRVSVPREGILVRASGVCPGDKLQMGVIVLLTGQGKPSLDATAIADAKNTVGLFGAPNTKVIYGGFNKSIRTMRAIETSSPWDRAAESTWAAANFTRVRTRQEAFAALLEAVQQAKEPNQAILMIDEGSEQGATVLNKEPVLDQASSPVLSAAVEERKPTQFVFAGRHCCGRTLAKPYDDSTNATVVCSRWDELLLPTDGLVDDEETRVPEPAPSLFCIEFVNAAIMSPRSTVRDIPRHVTGDCVRGQGSLASVALGRLAHNLEVFRQAGGLVFNRRLPIPGLPVSMDRIASSSFGASASMDSRGALGEWILRLARAASLTQDVAQECLRQLELAVRGDSADLDRSRRAPRTYAVFEKRFPFCRENSWTLSAVYRVVGVAGLSDGFSAKVMRDLLR
jgi:hypothetical protein